MSKRATVIPLIVLVVAALLFFVINGRWTSWSGGRAEQETDDAYVQGDMTPLSTRISGTVRKMEVEDFDSVKASQVLVEIDDDYRAIVEEAKAALAASQAALEDNQAAKRIQEAKIQNAEAMVAEAEAAVSTAQAGLASTQPDVERMAIERKRQEALLASKATTRQQLESAVSEAERYSGLLASRQGDLDRAQAALASSRVQLEAQKRELAALGSQDALYRADIKAKRAAITVAEVNLSYTRITAPANGEVGKRHVQEGQLVTPGMQMVDLVKGDAWILANYLETQLTNIRKGDTADIRIDAFPGVVLHGKVSVAAASIPARDECVRTAREQSPDIRAAQQAVEKAKAELGKAKDAYIPDLSGFARYSYQSGIAFLVHNFGTFGVTFTYELFDGGRRNAEINESRTMLSKAKLNLANVEEEVTVQAEIAYDTLEQMQSLVTVAEETFKARTEAARVAESQVEQNEILDSARAEASAKTSSAKASLLEANLGLSLAQGELKRAMGEIPR